MMKKTTILLALALVFLSGSHGNTLPFAFQDIQAMERSEGVPSSESEEHASIISVRATRQFAQAFRSKYCPLLTYKSAFRKVLPRIVCPSRDSLHILLRVLRH